MGKSARREENEGLKKGPWTAQEDQKLLAYVQQHGHGSWRFLPKKAGLQRCGKSCRLRWINYLRPDIKRGKFSLQEERTIIQLHALLGNRWSSIAAHLPNRTDNEIKNYWNTRLKKKLAMLGVDPSTHRRSAAPTAEKNGSTLSHMAQWESARLEAETRLVKASELTRRAEEVSADAGVSLSVDLILKNMPTTFAPPRCRILGGSVRMCDSLAPSTNDIVGEYFRYGPGSEHFSSGEVSFGDEGFIDINDKNYLSEIVDLLNCGPSSLPEFPGSFLL